MSIQPAELEDADGAERRAFFRVLTRIPVQCRRITPPEAEALAREIRERRAPQPLRIDEALAAWLDRIERKLDRVLVHMGIGDPVVFSDGSEIFSRFAGTFDWSDARQRTRPNLTQPRENIARVRPYRQSCDLRLQRLRVRPARIDERVILGQADVKCVLDV